MEERSEEQDFIMGTEEEVWKKKFIFKVIWR
jgi:hypothetical protein